MMQDSNRGLIYTTDKNHLALADLYAFSNDTNLPLKLGHELSAELLKAGILDLLWDSQKVSFFSLKFKFQ